MKTAILLPFLFLGLVQARYVFKRNAYGDEQVTPGPAVQPAAPVAAPEQSAQQLPVETTAQEAPVQNSGYRAKRGAQNGYGDEPVAPKQGYEAPAAPVAEQAVEQVPAQTAAQEAPVEHSGYRAKRNAQNSYGDEPAADAPKPGYAAETPAAPAPEQAVEQVPAQTAAQEAPVEHSGYRAKRGAQNSYGDEPVAPKQGYEAPAAAAPEQAVEQVPAQTAAQEAPVQNSGYRAKRGAQNAYGDEPVADAPKSGYAAETPAPAAPAPEQAVEQVPAQSVAQEAPVEHSGYRAKRNTQNSYGDEPAADAPKPGYGAETPSPAAPEQAVEQVPAQTAAQEAPVEHSGY